MQLNSSARGADVAIRSFDTYSGKAGLFLWLIAVKRKEWREFISIKRRYAHGSFELRLRVFYERRFSEERHRE